MMKNLRTADLRRVEHWLLYISFCHYLQFTCLEGNLLLHWKEYEWKILLLYYPWFTHADEESDALVWRSPCLYVTGCLSMSVWTTMQIIYKLGSPNQGWHLLKLVRRCIGGQKFKDRRHRAQPHWQPLYNTAGWIGSPIECCCILVLITSPPAKSRIGRCGFAPLPSGCHPVQIFVSTRSSFLHFFYSIPQLVFQFPNFWPHLSFIDRHHFAMKQWTD